MKKLFVGKLAPTTTEADLNTFFEQYGPLISAKIINDPYTGRCRGFGFVEIEDNAKAEEAIRTLNGELLNNSEVVVNEARPQENSRRDGGGGRSGGGRPYGGGGGGGRSDRGGFGGGGGGGRSGNSRGSRY